jgi:hypothetical protein
VEGAPEEEAKRCMLHDMSMYFKGYITDFHMQIFGTSKGPTNTSTGSFHFKVSLQVDRDLSFLGKIFSDDNDLGATVKYSCFKNQVID